MSLIVDKILGQLTRLISKVCRMCIAPYLFAALSLSVWYWFGDTGIIAVLAMEILTYEPR